MRLAYTCFFRSFAFLLFYLPLGCLAQKQGASVSFSFTLNKAASTSAGVYADDGRLIKTLWSGEKYTAGNHREHWDGTNDTGQTAPKGKYTVKVLSNNVKYTWEGVIGNTSDSLTGSTVFRSHVHLLGLAIVNNMAYYATGYNEQGPTTSKFAVNDPQKRIPIVVGKGMAAMFVSADNNNVYWAGGDAANPNKWFVFATKISDDSELLFASGSVFKTRFSRVYKSTIDNYADPTGMPSGLAVQHNGRFLFIAHQKLNLVNTYDKTTGNFIRSTPFDSPSLMTDDGNGGMWITSVINGSKTISRFIVKANGALTPASLILRGLTDPVALSVSPDKKILLVADAGSSQQLKAFNNITGALKLTFGKPNGYAADPNVSNDKFYFSDKRETVGSAIAYEADGSFWVEDAGNCRLQHFSPDFRFINRVMYINTSYSTTVDPNNFTRVFSDYLEFKINYNIPLAPNNGSWTLVKNWGANIPPELDNKYLRLRSLATLSNGRTYTTFFNKANNNWLVAELPTYGPIRFTSSNFNGNRTSLYPDGSLRTISKIVAGQPITWTERKLTTFNNGDPKWGDEKILASIPASNASDPVPSSNLTLLRPAEITSSNLIVVYGNAVSNLNAPNFHLGAILVGGHTWKWRTAIGTDRLYTGLFPTDGKFDNGNHVRYAGSVALIKERNIICGYYGEFWKNSEANKWNHFYDDGLMIGQFGVTGTDWGVKGADAPAMMAGNAFSAMLAKDSNGNIYLYHNDESQHGGIHRWKITGLNTIKEQEVQIKL